jgi:hypothetical protein
MLGSAPSVQSPAESSGDDLDALRALCTAMWQVAADRPRVAAADPASIAEIDRLGLGIA